MNWKKFCEVLLLLLTAVAVVIAITMWAIALKLVMGL